MKKEIKKALTDPNPVDTVSRLMADFQAMALDSGFSTEVLAELRKIRDNHPGTQIARIACRILPIIRRGTVDTAHALAHGDVTQTYDPVYGYGIPRGGL